MTRSDTTGTGFIERVNECSTGIIELPVKILQLNEEEMKIILSNLQYLCACIHIKVIVYNLQSICCSYKRHSIVNKLDCWHMLKGMIIGLYFAMSTHLAIICWGNRDLNRTQCWPIFLYSKGSGCQDY